MFSAADLHARLSAETIARIASLDVYDVVGSTNVVLAEAEPPPIGCWRVAIADEQSAGRGRGGNQWRSQPGAGLWLSAAYRFDAPPAGISSLTLALGVTVAEAIESLDGMEGLSIGLKWPNDLILNDGKLAGMLVELADNGRTVICGIGTNFRAPDPGSLEGSAPLPPIGLVDALGEDRVPSRLELAGRILDGAAEMLPCFSEAGLAPWRERYAHRDWLSGRAIVCHQGETETRGFARGIDTAGALRVEHDGKLQRILSASIRLDEQRLSA